MFSDPATLREIYNKEQFSNRTTKRIAIQNIIHQGKTCKTYLFKSENMMQETQEKKNININIPLSQLCMHSTLHGNQFRVSIPNKLFLSLMVAVQWCCQKQSNLTSFFLSLPLSVQMTPARMSPSPQTSCTLGPGLVLQLSTSEQPLPTSHSRCYHTAAHAAATRIGAMLSGAMEAFCSTSTSPKTATFIKDGGGQTVLRVRGACGCYRTHQRGKRETEGFAAYGWQRHSPRTPLLSRSHTRSRLLRSASISTRMGVRTEARGLAIGCESQ